MTARRAAQCAAKLEAMRLAAVEPEEDLEQVYSLFFFILFSEACRPMITIMERSESTPGHCISSTSGPQSLSDSASTYYTHAAGDAGIWFFYFLLFL